MSEGWRSAILSVAGQLPAVNCSLTAAHPWVYGLGQQTDNGTYLSPANAIAWLAEKLANTAGEVDLVVIMTAAGTHEEFLPGMDALAEVFPAPAFQQVSRLARSAAALPVARMQKPVKAAGRLPDAMPLSIPTLRGVSAAGIVAQASQPAGMSIAGIKAEMAGFEVSRNQMLADIAGEAGKIAGKSAPAWVFTGRGTGPTLVRNLLDGVPQLSAVFTAAIMLAGDNLEGIRGMIHECDNTGA